VRQEGDEDMVSSLVFRATAAGTPRGAIGAQRWAHAMQAQIMFCEVAMRFGCPATFLARGVSRFLHGLSEDIFVSRDPLIDPMRRAGRSETVNVIVDVTKRFMAHH
jgi:hypothetical protein